MGRSAVASKVFEIGRDHVCDSQATTNGSRSPRRSLRLREAQDPLTIRVFIIVGQDDRAIGSAQVLGNILAFADIAPLQPRAGAAGELAVAEMQPRLDQPKKRLVAHRKATAGGSSFEVGVANLARH